MEFDERLVIDRTFAVYRSLLPQLTVADQAAPEYKC